MLNLDKTTPAAEEEEGDQGEMSFLDKLKGALAQLEEISISEEQLSEALTEVHETELKAFEEKTVKDLEEKHEVALKELSDKLAYEQLQRQVTRTITIQKE